MDDKAKLIGISPRSLRFMFEPPLGEKRIREWIRSGLLKAHRIGIHSYVIWSDVENLLRTFPTTRQGGEDAAPQD
jgi:hypothetical protein